MSTLILISVILGVSVQNIVKKAYNIKVRSGGAFAFSGASAAIAALCFVIFSKGQFNFNREFLVYAFLFSLFYSMGVAFSVLAIKAGPLSLTSLISSYSLVVPALYGIIVIREAIDRELIFGIVLLLISLFFINMEKKDDKKITFKWIFLVFLAFLGNGGCSTVQTAQQNAFKGDYKNEFMIVALLTTAVTMFIVALFTERRSILPSIKKGFIWYFICGAANGIVNLFVMLLVSVYEMPASVMFPLISAGGIIVTAIVSITLYKERLTLWQKIGMVLGIGAIVLLNL